MFTLLPYSDLYTKHNHRELMIPDGSKRSIIGASAKSSKSTGMLGVSTKKWGGDALKSINSPRERHDDGRRELVISYGESNRSVILQFAFVDVVTFVSSSKRGLIL